MTLQYDRQITISAAGSRKAVFWPQQKLYISELVTRLETPARSTETLREYLALPKGQQDELKDVGGFVGGILAGERRKAEAVQGRDFISLDLDNIPAGETDTVLCRLANLGCGMCIYSTRKHDPGRPRLRVLVWLDTTCSPEEYEAIARKLAEIIGLELCDPTTFEPSRMMYWPSCCADGQYIYQVYDHPFLSVGGMLSMYSNWQDVSQWPRVPGEQNKVRRDAAKQGDPLEKAGIVGAFCRAYDIRRAIAELIPGVYDVCDGDRYTYTGGSTAGGAVLYDDGKFLYSHHATDPCSGKLVNAYDLVRLHKFGDLDDETKPDTPINRLPSYKAMAEFACSLREVSGLLTQERYEHAVTDFSAEPADTEWLRLLAVSSTTGLPAKTTDNVLIILDHDPALKGRIAYEEFSARNMIFGPVPWDKTPGARIMTDTDDAGIRHYMEAVHSITGKDRITDATVLCAHKHAYNEVQSYLNGLVWDGIPRIDTLLIDYFGAADTRYNREAIRKSLVAAVTRAYYPGTKHDEMLIIVGPQGAGKSTFLQTLGGKWFSDSQGTFEGKEALELIQGKWIIEIAELQAMSRSEVTNVKLFLSKRDDFFREAYGRRANNYPRRCIFFGTTNETEFLRDETGERRFWPVDTGILPPRKNVWTDLPLEVDQIWAEAVALSSCGESLQLSPDAHREAVSAQKAHKVQNAKTGIVQAFLDRRIPLDWYKRDIAERRMYWSGDFGSAPDTVDRTRVCAAEIYVECFGSDMRFYKQTDAREINNILSALGWKKEKSVSRYGVYGPQRGYVKV